MCRLYGFLANEPTKVDCSLVFAQNALLLQSRADEIGLDHADGWGIATYENGHPAVYRSAIAAFDDQCFSSTAEMVYSKAIVAHIRKATVGATSLENTHPFQAGSIIFAHNGTVAGFDSFRKEMEDQTDPDLQDLRVGTTDSEQYFLWLLTQIRRAGFLQGERFATERQQKRELEQLLLEKVRSLARRCLATGPDEPPRLNFVMTDGISLVTCRWNHSLNLLLRNGIYDCEICGIPHIHHHESINHQAIVVASEPITNEAWEPFENQSVRVFRIEPAATRQALHPANGQ